MTRLDADTDEHAIGSSTVAEPVLRLYESREVPLGGLRGTMVHRSLPQRALPMVGAWCFLDRFDDERSDMRVLPHPHIGLQTVTWPITGEILHRDSVGSEVVVTPGQLNLMTAGNGIAHSEFSTGDVSLPLRGLQFWTALPDESRWVPPSFEQHTELPRYSGPGIEATVFLGVLDGVRSPATTYSPIVGADATIEPGQTITLPLDDTFEHAMLLLDGDLEVEGASLESGPLLYLGVGRHSIEFTSTAGARVILLGGEPFAEDIVMWWNFVGRSHDEIVAARDDWEAGGERYGGVDGHGTARIPAPPLPGVRLTPRRRG